MLANYLLNQLLLVDGREGFIAFNATDDIGHNLLKIREDAVLLQVLCDAPAHLERLRFLVLDHPAYSSSLVSREVRAERAAGAKRPPCSPVIPSWDDDHHHLMKWMLLRLDLF